VQEKLSHYLDQVEVSIAQQVRFEWQSWFYLVFLTPGVITWLYVSLPSDGRPAYLTSPYRYSVIRYTCLVAHLIPYRLDFVPVLHHGDQCFRIYIRFYTDPEPVLNLSTELDPAKNLMRIYADPDPGSSIPTV
jgi:hypothetical protein